MRVFVSSVVCGYEEFRSEAKQVIEALGHVPVVMERTHPASPDSPREACLEEVADSNVVVLLAGHRYGGVLESGKSATHEEWDHALGLNKDILVFVEDLDCSQEHREERQEGFLKEVGDWVDGRLWGRYSTPIELMREIVAALTELQADSDDTEQDPAERLPQGCRERVET